MKPANGFAAGLLLLASCDQQSDSDAQAGPDGQVDTSSFEAPVPLPASAFVSMMAAGDAYEAESSRLAIERASSSAVRAYARSMLDAHEASSDRLKEVADQSGKPFVATYSREQQRNLLLLKDVPDDRFDRLYIDNQIEAHQAAIKALEDFASSDPSPALRQYAELTLPVVQGHLDRARRLAGN